MSFDKNFKFETFEKFFGDISQIKRLIDSCNLCGSNLIHSHLADYKNLYMEEQSRCLECGSSEHGIIHIIN